MQTKEAVLQACTIHGNTIKLPDVQLDRKLYMDVANAINLIGGKWKGGKVMGFEFPHDPADLFEQIKGGANRNLKKELQFFETPADLADRLVKLADIEATHSICEPSAGQGAIIKAIFRKLCNHGFVDFFEISNINRDLLKINLGLNFQRVSLMGEDFLKYDEHQTYDRIIANPPFSKGQDMQHIYKMYDCLSDGGRLVSVASKSWQIKGESFKKEKDFKKWLDAHNASVIEVEAGAFKESGTTIPTCIIVIDK